MFQRQRVAAASLALAALVVSGAEIDYARLQYSPSQKGQTAIIDPATSWGRWDGWGVSLAWWANIFGQHDDLADAIFTTKSHVSVSGLPPVPGLGLNIARYNLGGSAWRQYQNESMAESPDIPKFRQIEGFWQDGASDDPSSLSWNWTADANQVSMLKKGKARGVDQFELFSNSPMWWMLKNRNPCGSDSGTSDNLATDHSFEFAKYMTTFAAVAAKKWGVQFASIEPFNEPISDWWTADHNQEGCHFGRPTQNSFVQKLHKEMKRQGVGAIVAASDENQYDQARVTWRSFDDAAKAKVGRVNVHGYQGLEGRRDLLYKDVQGKPLWNTEYGDDDGSGMTMAAVIHMDFQYLHNTAWCYWQVLDDAPGWGLGLFLDKGTIKQFYPKWFIFAHYSRHIKPGMTIIESGNSNTVAAYDPSARKLVIVSANYKKEQLFSYDLSKFKSVGVSITRWRTDTSNAGERYVKHQDVTLSHGKFEVHFSKHTVQTFEIHDVEMDDGAAAELVV